MSKLSPDHGPLVSFRGVTQVKFSFLEKLCLFLVKILLGRFDLNWTQTIAVSLDGE